MLRLVVGRPLWLALVLLLLPRLAAAQLRPLDPVDWALWTDSATWVAGAGAAVYQNQHASLAGTVGRLVEIGNLEAGWRSGRIAVVAGGTLQRLFQDQDRFAEEHGGAVPGLGPARHDAGDYRIATLVRLTPAKAPVLTLLRFGARLPTTDNEVGLDRDRTDFFALLSTRWQRGPAAAAVEAGVGIWGTREVAYEQEDVLVYAATAEYRLGPVVPTVAIVGQRAGHSGWAVRGNENLSEVRLGVTVGRRYWVRLQAVRGLETFSPGTGLIVAAGTLR